MKKLMNSQGIVLLLTILAALTGALLRLAVLSHELQADGTLLSGSHRYIVLLVVLVLYLALLIVLLRPLRRKRSWQEVFPAGSSLYYPQLLCALLLFVGNICVLAKGPAVAQQQIVSSFTRVSSRLLPWLGFAAAACIGVFCVQRVQKRKPSPLLYMVVSVYLVVRLILNFQSWNTDPSIHDYCYRLLAAICTMLAAYHLAGFCLDVGRRRMTAFWALCAVVFNAIAFVDYAHAKNWGELLVSLTLCLSMLLSAVQVLYATGKRRRLAAEQTPGVTPPTGSEEAAD